MNNIDNLKFGDIVLADLPFSDGSQTKIRPVLILLKDRYDYLVMKVSSIVDKKQDVDLLITPDSSNKLLEDSVFKTKDIWKFSREILGRCIGELSTNDCHKIKKNLVYVMQNL